MISQMTLQLPVIDFFKKKQDNKSDFQNVPGG
jgi:hypothetical protein